MLQRLFPRLQAPRVLESDRDEVNRLVSREDSIQNRCNDGAVESAREEDGDSSGWRSWHWRDCSHASSNCAFEFRDKGAHDVEDALADDGIGRQFACHRHGVSEGGQSGIDPVEGKDLLGRASVNM